MTHNGSNYSERVWNARMVSARREYDRNTNMFNGERNEQVRNAQAQYGQRPGNVVQS